jgi:phosphodiesterase/alkaline phosphatase D-like protein
MGCRRADIGAPAPKTPLHRAGCEGKGILDPKEAGMKKIMLMCVAAALIAVPTVALGAVGSPSVTTGDTTSITNTSGSVHGTVNPEGQSTQYAFQYGTSSKYGHQTTLTSAGAGTTDQSVSATIRSLPPGTTYHYRMIAISSGGSGGTSTGTDHTFKTTGTAPVLKTPPTVTTGTAGAINAGGATVSGTVNPNGLTASYYFEFGTTSAYGFQTSPASAGALTAVKSVSGTLSGLASDQTYHYRLVAVNAGGTTVGADAQFKTNSTPPTASTLKQFGQTGFVSPSGVGGVLVGCIGQTKCQGSLRLLRGGVTLGHRGVFFIGANDGGVIHIQLNARGQSQLGQGHHLRVNVVLSEQGGQTVTGIITLVRFS